MEFTTLTRRVAEFAGIDAGEIEPSKRQAHARRCAQAAPAHSGAVARRARPASRARAGSEPAAAPPGRRGMATPSRRRRSPPRAARPRATPRSIARATRSCATLERLEALDRARARARRRRDRYRDHRASIRCRPSCAASRSRSRRTRPATCRSPTARRRRRRRRCSPARLRPDQIAERDALAALQAAAGRPRRAQDRPEPQIRLAVLRAARHRARAATTTPC